MKDASMRKFFLDYVVNEFFKSEICMYNVFSGIVKRKLSVVLMCVCSCVCVCAPTLQDRM